MLGYRKIMSQLPVWYTLIVISLLKQSSRSHINISVNGLWDGFLHLLRKELIFPKIILGSFISANRMLYYNRIFLINWLLKWTLQLLYYLLIYLFGLIWTVLSIDRELDLLMKYICFCLLLGIKSKNSDFEEAVARKCLVKKVFLKISQNS